MVGGPCPPIGAPLSHSPDSLRRAHLDQLQTFAVADKPSPLQMHALEELAHRALLAPDLLDGTVAAVAGHVGQSSRLGGRPVGYPGASVLYRGGEHAHRALLAALGSLPGQDRDELLLWLIDDQGPAVQPSHKPVERELLLELLPDADRVRQAISMLIGGPAEVELMGLEGSPACLALVSMPLHGWAQLDREAGFLAQDLGGYVVLVAPEALAELHPDLRLQVHADGARRLVLPESTEGGVALRPFTA